MTNIIIFAIIGTLVGFYERDLRAKISELYKRLPKDKEPDVGATMASYDVYNPDAKVNQSGEVGISEPKSPAVLEWEERDRLEKMQLNVKVKPRR
jgi:hypothetical protein